LVLDCRGLPERTYRNLRAVLRELDLPGQIPIASPRKFIYSLESS